MKKTLEDIKQAIKEIDSFFESRPKRYDLYITDLCLRRAVEREIGIIGEAMNRILKIKPDIKITSSRKIVGTRNYVVHAYDSVTNDIIWGIVINHLPVLEAEIDSLLTGAE